MPKIAQRKFAVRWMQGTPAGLPSELIEGAMQQAPQPGRQSMVFNRRYLPAKRNPRYAERTSAEFYAVFL